MKLTKNTGRILGLLFLTSVIAGATVTMLRGLAGFEPNTEGFLLELIKNASQMKNAIYLDMLSSTIGIVIAVFLYPYLKKYDLRLAVTYLGISFVSFALIALSNVTHFGMLTVASEFQIAGGSNPENYTTFTKMLYEGYYWIHFLVLTLYAVGGFLLYLFFFKTKLIHQWLAIWGIVASLVVFMGGALQLAEQSVSFLFFLQNGIFVLSFIIYLLIFGFRAVHYKELAGSEQV
ncbi:DUF4386 domain-containing protein [Flavobacteriaceae bacterium M23B6Z8]